MGLAFKKQREVIGRVFQQCPACESPYLEYEFVVERSPVCGCQDCGLVFLNPQPGGRRADEPAPSAPAGAEEVYERNAIEKIDQLIEYSGLQSGVLLLIGGDSHLTEAAVNRDFEVVAFDPLQFESAPAEGLRILADACILFCALEKMKDPLGTLQAIRSVLKPSGSLMVISPTTDTRTVKRSKASWWVFKKANLFYFSVDTLQNLLLRAGFGDPFITADRGLVSLNLLRKTPASNPRVERRYRWLRSMTLFSPLLRNKKFRLFDGRTRFLSDPKFPRPNRCFPLSFLSITRRPRSWSSSRNCWLKVSKESISRSSSSKAIRTMEAESSLCGTEVIPAYE